MLQFTCGLLCTATGPSANGVWCNDCCLVTLAMITPMIENNGINLSGLNHISDVDIKDHLESLMSLDEIVTREDASESFEALEN